MAGRGRGERAGALIVRAPAADEALAADVAAGRAAPANRMHDYLAARTSFFDRTVVSALDRGVGQVAVGAVLILSLLVLAIGLMLERAGRRRAEVSLGERLRFETLLSEQVATFSRISAVDVDREIQRALRRIADLLGVDWGNLTEYSDDSRTARVTHWWVADGVGPQPEAIGFEEIPWVVSRLRRGELRRRRHSQEACNEAITLDRTHRFRVGHRIFLRAVSPAGTTNPARGRNVDGNRNNPQPDPASDGERGHDDWGLDDGGSRWPASKRQRMTCIAAPAWWVRGNRWG